MKDNNAITIRTLAEETTPASGLVQFNLESLTTKEIFTVNDAVVVPGFMDDERVLPHKINTANLEHFKGVKIPTIPEVNSVDILIGQPHKFLFTVLEEREGARPEESNYVLTRLGPIASGESLNVESSLHHNFKINKVEEIHKCSCEQLKQEVSFLKHCLRNYEIKDELIQPSKNDEITRLLVEPNIKVIDNRYEIPVL